MELLIKKKKGGISPGGAIVVLTCEGLIWILSAIAIRQYVFTASPREPLPRGLSWGGDRVWSDL